MTQKGFLADKWHQFCGKKIPPTVWGMYQTGGGKFEGKRGIWGRKEGSQICGGISHDDRVRSGKTIFEKWICYNTI